MVLIDERREDIRRGDRLVVVVARVNRRVEHEHTVVEGGVTIRRGEHALQPIVLVDVVALVAPRRRRRRLGAVIIAARVRGLRVVALEEVEVVAVDPQDDEEHALVAQRVIGLGRVIGVARVIVRRRVVDERAEVEHVADLAAALVRVPLHVVVVIANHRDERARQPGGAGRALSAEMMAEKFPCEFGSVQSPIAAKQVLASYPVVMSPRCTTKSQLGSRFILEASAMCAVFPSHPLPARESP